MEIFKSEEQKEKRLKKSQQREPKELVRHCQADQHTYWGGGVPEGGGRGGGGERQREYVKK